MHSKYTPLGIYLRSISIDTKDLALSFEEIEKILNFRLPSSAYEYQAWWAFEIRPSQPQKVIWQNSGWRVLSIDLSRRSVRFQRSLKPIEGLIQTTAERPITINTLPSTTTFEPQLEPIFGHMALEVIEPAWDTVFVIPHGTLLTKGRHGIYDEITKAAGTYPYRFGCYAWANTSTIFYCGSIAANYMRGRFNSNLQARVHNYLQNHRTKETGNKNTNLMVFERISLALESEDILLKAFHFEKIVFGQEIIDFATFSQNSNLVRAIEELLIAWYRKLGQCQWNRT